MKTHFVFDFDDTISSSYDFNQDMFVQTFPSEVAEKHEGLLRRVHRENRGTGMEQQFQSVIDQLGLSLNAEQMVLQNEKLHVQNFKQMTIFPSVPELFSKFKERGHKISMCTNRQYDSLNAILQHHGLDKYLDNVISCKDEGFEKPDPTCLLDLVRKEGGNKDDFIYFGDSKTDYEFASNAGMDFIIVDHYLNGKNFYHMIVRSFLSE